MTQVNTPQKIKWLEKKKELSILWKDAHESLFSLEYLRHQCPCALCDSKKKNRDPFKIIKEIPKDIEVLHIEPVGHYAVQIEWNDGHSTGIYTFDYLRKLCSCPACH